MTRLSSIRRVFAPSKSKDVEWRSLLRIATTSWSLLTKDEKLFFIIRVVVRLALNGLDIVAVGLMGLLGALTATGLSGQRLNLFGYEIPEPSAENVVLLVATVAFLLSSREGWVLFSPVGRLFSWRPLK